MIEAAGAETRAVLRDGLAPSTAARLLREQGPNELPPPARTSLLRRAIGLLAEPMALLLLAAAAVSAALLGSFLDAGAILAIVVANTAIALVQDGRASRALEALRSLTAPSALVRRGGRVERIPAREIVVGDVVLLAAGDRVPADALLVASTAAEVDEAILTGESLPVAKEPGDRVLSGTLVVRGAAEAAVEGTGPGTRLGSIARGLAATPPPTPLQRELRRATKILAVAALAIAAGVFGLTLARLGIANDGLGESFLAAAALAVAAVPEGLPTVVTVALALGVGRMAGHGAIVRRMPAVETLGATTVILTDKTGTLTENRMAVAGFVAGGLSVRDVEELPAALAGPLAESLTICNNATLEPPSGDPMERALLESAGPLRAVAARVRRIAEVPFDSERKMMSVLALRDGDAVLVTKGAPEVVLPRCRAQLDATGRARRLDGDAHVEIARSVSSAASSGRRVLALARRDANAGVEAAAQEHDLTLIGLVMLRDPVRAEAAAAVAGARAAGVRLVMVTGDHPGTAAAIAQETGLASAAARASTEVDDAVASDVYARIDPEGKLALVEALRRSGEVVAVTGDGVNDAPALRAADIGVAMGAGGTDVAREASDLIITDDNLATIVEAVREGRGIYDAVRKVVEYLVAGNFSEIIVVVGALIAFPEMGVPLLPLQLLWINLLTDGFPALALGVDPPDPSLMRRPPRPASDQLLTSRRLLRLLGRGALLGGSALTALAVVRYAWGEPWSHARAVMFSALMMAHLLYAYAVRRPAAGRRAPRNRWIHAAVGGGLALQAIVVWTPPLQRLFATAPLSAREWLLVVAAGVVPVTAIRYAPGTAARRPATW